MNVCVDIKRLNQRTKFLLKLLIDYDHDNAYKWFCEVVERKNCLLLDSEQIPFDIIFFGFLNYMVALHDNVYSLVREKEMLVFPKKKKVYPYHILDTLKNKADKNKAVVISLENISSVLKTNGMKEANNYFKHQGMPYTWTSTDKTFIEFIIKRVRFKFWALYFNIERRHEKFIYYDC